VIIWLVFHNFILVKCWLHAWYISYYMMFSCYWSCSWFNKLSNVYMKTWANKCLLQLSWEGRSLLDEHMMKLMKQWTIMRLWPIRTMSTKCLYKWVTYVIQAWARKKFGNRVWSLIQIVDKFLGSSGKLACRVAIKFWEKFPGRTILTEKFSCSHVEDDLCVRLHPSGWAINPGWKWFQFREKVTSENCLIYGWSCVLRGL